MVGAHLEIDNNNWLIRIEASEVGCVHAFDMNISPVPGFQSTLDGPFVDAGALHHFSDGESVEPFLQQHIKS